MLAVRWTTPIRRFRNYLHLTCLLGQRQSTSISPASLISPTLLGRARNLAAEHAQLSKQLDTQYDAQIAKKVGSLASVTTALENWEAANSVRTSLLCPRHVN